MVEVEVKYAAGDFAAVAARLASRGAVEGEPRDDADEYFNAPDRDFARTDEALRLRRIGPENRVTYKGPRRDAQTKTRTEIEVPLAPGDSAARDFARLLACLGYRPVAVVHKHRRTFHLHCEGFAVEATLDDVADVGRYIELEIVVPEESLPAARATVLRLAADLGLTAPERRSYLELLLAKKSHEERS